MTIDSIEQLGKYINLSDSEKAWHESPVSLPVKITQYYLSLIDKNDPLDPLRRIAVPDASENVSLNLEDNDPQMESTHSAMPRLVHRYTNRVAFLATDICAQYCRHCFRRRFTGNMTGPASDSEVQEACGYIASHPEIKEMLLTGGDPLSMSDDHLDRMLGAFRKASPSLIIRICTRYPVVQPSRITRNLVEMIKSHSSAAFYLMTHFNHPRELTQQAKEAVALFVNNGIPAMNQSVLLRGVNDDAKVLEQLCNDLVAARIKPYYLFQGDLVTGTGALRVPLERGMEIEKTLRKNLSGLAMPVYCADLPEGGGKVPLCGSYIDGRKDNVWIFRTLDGDCRFYPDPEM